MAILLGFHCRPPGRGLAVATNGPAGRGTSALVSGAGRRELNSLASGFDHDTAVMAAYKRNTHQARSV